MAVTGVGGIFFRARNPEALLAWYKQHLGIPTEDYGQWTHEAGPSVFMPFAHDTDHFAADKQWMINLRVDDLAGMLATLRGAGLEVITKPEWDDPMTGLFARLHDPEGNAIELWQPPD